GTDRCAFQPADLIEQGGAWTLNAKDDAAGGHHPDAGLTAAGKGLNVFAVDARRQWDARRAGTIDAQETVARHGPDDAVAVDPQPAPAAHRDARRVGLPGGCGSRKSKNTVRGAHPDARIGRRRNGANEAETCPWRNAMRDQTVDAFGGARPDVAVAIF